VGLFAGRRRGGNFDADPSILSNVLTRDYCPSSRYHLNAKTTEFQMGRTEYIEVPTSTLPPNICYQTFRLSDEYGLRWYGIIFAYTPVVRFDKDNHWSTTSYSILAHLMVACAPQPVRWRVGERL
jgi:hypothetical protein